VVTDLLRRRGRRLALVEIVALLVAVAATTAVFWRVEGRAGALFVPYLGWVCFATVLNASIVALN
jgi:tryptophan-rich sensory protein